MSQHEIDLAVTAFVRAETPKLAWYLSRKGATKQQAEDCIQHTMLEMFRRWDINADPQMRRAYMYTTARNALFKEWRKAERRGEQELTTNTQVADPQQDTHVTALANGIEPDVVTKILQSLPPKQRTIMALLTDGYEQEEIAETLGVPSATVRSSLRYARKKLKDALSSRATPPGEGEEREGLHRRPA